MDAYPQLLAVAPEWHKRMNSIIKNALIYDWLVNRKNLTGYKSI